jgi:hypothetical protein
MFYWSKQQHFYISNTNLRDLKLQKGFRSFGDIGKIEKTEIYTNCLKKFTNTVKLFIFVNFIDKLNSEFFVSQCIATVFLASQRLHHTLGTA